MERESPIGQIARWEDAQVFVVYRLHRQIRDANETIQNECIFIMAKVSQSSLTTAELLTMIVHYCKRAGGWLAVPATLALRLLDATTITIAAKDVARSHSTVWPMRFRAILTDVGVIVSAAKKKAFGGTAEGDYSL